MTNNQQQTTNNKQQFCFSILALGAKYQLLAKEFAKDLEKHSPETTVVVGTDNPQAFQDCSQVLAFKLDRKGIFHCYHDKRFVIEQALTKFPVVIQIDADTRIIGSLPESMNNQVSPEEDYQKPNLSTDALAAVHIENLVEHVQKYNPERLNHLRKLAAKLEIDLDTVTYIGESLFAVLANGDKTVEFIQQWDAIARYLELHGIHGGSGNGIGLAAAKVGLEIIQPSWLEEINQVRHHIDASRLKSRKTLGNKLKRRIGYHYRLNKERIIAIKDFNFYYH
ncbi:MAG: hypothetical protein F6K47_13715 [Symploca sp. SIO2E6]|nr:hypothetical protein [Symploca sp. SIO2E6]